MNQNEIERMLKSNILSRENIDSQNSNYIMSPQIDHCFKLIMHNDKARLGFLSAVLNIPPESIKSTVILNPNQDKFYNDDKLSILDVKVELNNNTFIDIEMQVTPFKYWRERSLYYNARMYIDQMQLSSSSDKNYSRYKNAYILEY